MKKYITILRLVFFSVASCSLMSGGSLHAEQSETVPRVERSIFLGIDHLQEREFDLLKGKRVGLLTNQAGVNRFGESTIQILHRAENVNLVALFGPEHGIYGDAKADVPVQDQIDRRTGLPVYSLYGPTRKPTPAMLEDIDVLVIDLQDIGVRSYTYVSCMKLAIEACFEQNKEVIVLDRPNPLGGLKVDGPMMEERWMSYVGAYRVPYVHGLTIGELSRMLKEIPGWLNVEDEVRRDGKITIVPMKGWRRSMLWPQTGLRWVQTSPAIPTVAAVLGYPMTGLGAQIGNFRHGYGTPFPFRLLTFAGKSPATIQRELERLEIPGLSFEIRRYQQPNGQIGVGVYILVDDFKELRPTELSFYMMQLTVRWTQGNPYADASVAQMELFNKHVGSTAWWDALVSEGSRVNVPEFVEKFTEQSKTFQEFSRRFWIYQ